MELHQMSCVPCRGGVPALSHEEVSSLLARIKGWEAPRDHHLAKTFRFPDFRSALAFVDRVGAMAEEQGHHPDLHLGWGRVGVEIWTHKIDGLTESDFILAAKCDQLASVEA
ncbi:MAG TPA: 4a-hydroxytetrahydrobiopterin dehydratase [Anaeromyxobacteraceae bacterium]|nr:4a-hydroxytetrahydrobiopterin dehydratase [Anaeromyxobacteraceae bacterium]